MVLALTLGWANDCGWLAKNPCTRIKLPKRTGGRKVLRTVLTPEQVKAIAEKLEEPYATLGLFLAASGLRIGEAIALRWSDFNGNVLHVQRRIVDGEVDAVKSKTSERALPVDPALLERMKELGKGEWVFRSRTGTPINPGNALKRYLQPGCQRTRQSARRLARFPPHTHDYLAAQRRSPESDLGYPRSRESEPRDGRVRPCDCGRLSAANC